MFCKNCGKALTLEDSYCSGCGGRKVETRFTMNSLASEAFGDIFGWDSRFWDTLFALFSSPKKVIQGYLDGERGRFMNPFSFYAFLLSISVIVMTVFQPQLSELMDDYFNSTGQAKLDMGWFFNYQGLVAFILLPFYTLIAFFSFKKPYNFSEHLIINVFVMAMITIIGVFMFLIFALIGSGKLYMLSSYIIMITTYIYVYQNIYQANFKKWMIFILRFIAVSVLISLILILIGVGVTIVMNIKG